MTSTPAAARIANGSWHTPSVATLWRARLPLTAAGIVLLRPALEGRSVVPSALSDLAPIVVWTVAAALAFGCATFAAGRAGAAT